MTDAHVLQTALAQLKTRLTVNYPIVRLVLFGSVVRGTMDDESDVDVLRLFGDRQHGDYMVLTRV
jgi:predicted nucleotidyltransferase